MLTSLIGFIFSLHHTTHLIKNLAQTISSLANHQQAQGMLSESLVTHHPLSSVPYPSSTWQDAWNGHGCLERQENAQIVIKD